MMPAPDLARLLHPSGLDNINRVVTQAETESLAVRLADAVLTFIAVDDEYDHSQEDTVLEHADMHALALKLRRLASISGWSL